MSDIDECKSNPCIAEAFCTNLYPYYQCTCDVGYAGDGRTCTGIASQIYLILAFRMKIFSLLCGLLVMGYVNLNQLYHLLDLENMLASDFFHWMLYCRVWLGVVGCG